MGGRQAYSANCPSAGWLQGRHGSPSVEKRPVAHGVHAICVAPPVRSVTPGSAQSIRVVPLAISWPGSQLRSQLEPSGSVPDAPQLPRCPFSGGAMPMQQPGQSHVPSV
jgi:hypothetical protein